MKNQTISLIKKILLIAICIALQEIAVSQNLIVRSYVEKTTASIKLGTALGLKSELGWEFGAFYQEASLDESLFANRENKQRLSRNFERNFGGLYFNAPVVLKESYAVKVNVRTGVSNGENFVITPTVLADYYMFKRLSVGLGLGARAFRPTFQASFSFAL